MEAQTRQKVTLRANAELMAIVRLIAENQGISPAGVVDRLLLDGLKRYAQGEIEFDGFLESTIQGRYAWTVEVNPNGLEEANLRKTEHNLTAESGLESFVAEWRFW